MLANTTPISEFMTKSLHSIAPRESLTQARKRMDEFGLRHLPVLDGGRLVGILSERDLNLVLGLRATDDHQLTVEDVMVPEVLTVNTGTTIKDVASRMIVARAGSAVVCDADGRVVGIFTDTDALKLLTRIP